MAEKSFPFDGGTVVGEPEWAAMARGFMRDGVLLAYGDGKPYGDSSGRQVKIPVMVGAAGGHYYENDAIKTISIAANATGSPRWDRVVMRADRTANTVTTVVIAGTAPSTLPALVRTSTTWDVDLGKVVVANGAVTITAADVTDIREISRGLDNADGSMVKVGEHILSSTGHILIPNIPQTFKSLQLRIAGRSAETGTGGKGVRMQINGDNSLNYYSAIHSTEFTPPSTTVGFHTGYGPHADGELAVFPGAGEDVRFKGAFVADLLDYTNPSRGQLWTSHGSFVISGKVVTQQVDGWWDPVTKAAVHTLGTAEFVLASGTHAELYGIR